MVRRPDNTQEKPKVLVLDDDLYLLAAIRQTLQMNGYHPETVDNSVDALDVIAGGDYLAVVSDVKMPRMDGLELLSRVQQIDPELPVILITGHGDISMAVKAMKNGAYDFLEKPVDEALLLASVSRAVEKMGLVSENRRLSRSLKQARQERKGFHGLIGRHPVMQQLYDTIAKVADEDDTVLICGETGTGKELVAKAIHDLSERRPEPFVAINMGAIPGEMMESELFGFEKGAYTGAVHTKIGKFEFAGAGTLFLDEICSLPPPLQSKLLRTLEEKTITRLGSNSSIPVRARIIAATNRELLEEIKKNSFREDLYYRLHVLTIRVPALRQRREDIPLLVDLFREEYCRDRKQDIGLFDEITMKQLMQMDFPGNVRELKNMVRRLCIYGPGSLLPILGGLDQAHNEQEGRRAGLKELLEKTEKEHIVETLRLYNGKVPVVIKLLGISRKCLYDKINKYGIEMDLFRSHKK